MCSKIVALSFECLEKAELTKSSHCVNISTTDPRQFKY